MALAVGCDTATEEDFAFLRVIHADPAIGAVDILVEKERALSSVEYGTVSPYLDIDEDDDVDLEIQAVTNDAADPIGEELDLEAGMYYTFAVTGGTADVLLIDDITEPKSGEAALRLLHGASEAGPVDIFVTEPDAALDDTRPTFSIVAFNQSTIYADLPAGTYRVRVAPAGTRTPVLDETLTLETGETYTAVATNPQGERDDFGIVVAALD